MRSLGTSDGAERNHSPTNSNACIGDTKRGTSHLVYTAIALTTGFVSWVPYLLPLWMCALLSHRALRDDRRCRAKYGALWEVYCQRATFRMVPFIY